MNWILRLKQSFQHDYSNYLCHEFLSVLIPTDEYCNVYLVPFSSLSKRLYILEARLTKLCYYASDSSYTDYFDSIRDKIGYLDSDLSYYNNKPCSTDEFKDEQDQIKSQLSLIIYELLELQSKVADNPEVVIEIVSILLDKEFCDYEKFDLLYQLELIKGQELQNA